MAKPILDQKRIFPQSPGAYADRQLSKSTEYAMEAHLAFPSPAIRHLKWRRGRAMWYKKQGVGGKHHLAAMIPAKTYYTRHGHEVACRMADSSADIRSTKSDVTQPTEKKSLVTFPNIPSHRSGDGKQKKPKKPVNVF